MIKIDLTGSSFPVFKGDFKSWLTPVGEYMVSAIQKRIYSTRSERSQSTGRLASSGYYSIDDRGVTTSFGRGIPYARIQHFGGFIKGSPVTVIRRFIPTGKTRKTQAGALVSRTRAPFGVTEFGVYKPWQTVQMARYFWARWYATGDDYYKWTALKVHKQGGIWITGKLYMLMTGEDEIQINKILGSTFWNDLYNFPIQHHYDPNI